MKKMPETQAFLDEAKTPKTVTPGEVMQAVKRFVPTLGKLSEQTAVLARLLQDSEIAEENVELRSLYERQFQALGALRRQAGDLERFTREMVGTLRQFQEVDAEVRAAAAKLGYEA